MKTPVKDRSGSLRPETSSWASKDSTYEFTTPSMRTAVIISNAHKLTCDPQPLRAIEMLIPPNSSWPPFFAFSTFRESRIAPAQVPHTGFRVRNSLRGSSNPDKRARSAMVVDSDYPISIKQHRISETVYLHQE